MTTIPSGNDFFKRSILYLPFKSVAAPMDVPTTRMLAPNSPCPLLLVIFPETFITSNAARLDEYKAKMKINFNLIVMLKDGHQIFFKNF